MNEVWKWVSGMMATMLTTGLIAWFSFGGGVSRAEGEELKRKDSAIESNQAVIAEKLARQQRDIDELKEDVKEGNAQTQQKLEQILERLPRK